MRKGTAAILALALTMGCLTACSDKPKETTMDPFAAQFVFATDSTGTVETAVTTEPEPTEPFKGYKIVNIYLNGDLLAVRYYNTAGNVTNSVAVHKIYLAQWFKVILNRFIWKILRKSNVFLRNRQTFSGIKCYFSYKLH